MAHLPTPRSRSSLAFRLLSALLAVAASCGGGRPTESTGSGPPSSITPPGANVHVFRMSFVQAGETTQVNFHGYPVWCGSLLPCAALLVGFPPPAGGTSQVSLRAGRSMFGSGWIDNGYLIFHPYITHTGTWLPAQCRGQCVTMDLTLGIPILPVPAPPPPYPPIKLVLSPLPLTLVWNITTTSPTRVVATFTGSFVRLRNQVLVDTVTVSDGYLDAQNSP